MIEAIEMQSNQAGFTLIELVVVIVILAILAATALPRLQALDNDARRAAVQGDLAALQSAAAITYGKTRASSTLASIWSQATFSDPLFSLIDSAGLAVTPTTFVCNTNNTDTTIYGAYTQTTATTQLSSVTAILGADLCSG
jgi:prepilin-type N-terminal cleavage/methylation domain-containing protein